LAGMGPGGVMAREALEVKGRNRREMKAGIVGDIWGVRTMRSFVVDSLERDGGGEEDFIYKLCG
jgi:hypothetical protein